MLLLDFSKLVSDYVRATDFLAQYCLVFYIVVYTCFCNKMYEKYGGAWNSDAATGNPGEHVIEADDVVEPTEEK